MKFILVVKFYFLGILYINAQSFGIDGTIRGCLNNWVYLSDYGKNKNIDSTVCKNGFFSFTGELSEPKMIKLHQVNDKSWSVFFIEPGKIYFEATKDSLWYPKIKGSKINEIHLEYEFNVINPIRERLIHYSILKENLNPIKDSTEIKLCNNKIDSLYAESLEKTVKLIRQNSNNFISIYFLNIQYGAIGLDKSKELLTNIDDKIKNTPTGRSLTSKIYKIGKLNIGDLIPNFILTDINTKLVSSKSFLGKALFLFNFARFRF